MGALAYILTTYTYHRFTGLPVNVYCNYTVTGAGYRITDKTSGYIDLQFAGTADRQAVVRVIFRSRTLKNVELTVPAREADGPMKPAGQTRSYQAYIIAGNSQIRINCYW